MESQLITVPPETETLEAIDLMRKHRISCLPILRDGVLVGMVTETNFMNIARELLERKLGSREHDPRS